MTRAAVAVALVLALLGAGYGAGWHQRGVADLAAASAAQVKADATAANEARDLAIEEQRRRAGAVIEEDAAREDPVANRSVLSPGRLHRINAAIAAANGPLSAP